MATAIIFAVFGVSALVFHKPDTAGCDYDFYVRYMADGRIKSLLSLSGKPFYNAIDFVFCFCMALSIVLTMESLLLAPKTVFSDALWVLWLLVWVMRYAHHAIFRSWHFTGSHWAVLCCALMCLVQTLAVVFCGIVGFVLVSSASALICISVLPVLAGLALQLAATCYVTNSVRINKHLYDSVVIGNYTVPAPNGDMFGEKTHNLGDLQ